MVVQLYKTASASRNPRLASFFFCSPGFSITPDLLAAYLDPQKYTVASSTFFKKGGESSIYLRTYASVKDESFHQVAVKMQPSKSEINFAKKYATMPQNFPFVMPIYAFEEVIGGMKFSPIMMPLAHCDGEEFLNRIQRFFRSPDASQKITAKMALYYVAISLMHAIDDLADQNTVHRDLRLPNVLFSILGHVVMSDFGIAKFEDEYPSGVSHPGAIAPEEFTRKATTKSDVWSLGSLYLTLILNAYPLNFRKSLQAGTPMACLLSIRASAREMSAASRTSSGEPASPLTKPTPDRFDPTSDSAVLETIKGFARELGLSRFADFALTLMKTNPDERPTSADALMTLCQLASTEFGDPLPIDDMRAAVREILAPSKELIQEEDSSEGSDFEPLE